MPRRGAGRTAKSCRIGFGVARQPTTGVQRRLERRRRLQRVDLQRVDRLRVLSFDRAPEQFRPLTFGEFRMGVGEAVEDVGGGVGADHLAVLTDEPIAEADEVVADVDGGADAVARCSVSWP